MTGPNNNRTFEEIVSDLDKDADIIDHEVTLEELDNDDEDVETDDEDLSFDERWYPSS